MVLQISELFREPPNDFQAILQTKKSPVDSFYRSKEFSRPIVISSVIVPSIFW